MKMHYDNHFENTRFIATFNIAICGSYTPPTPEGNYFTGTRGSGTKYFAGDHIFKDQTMYVYAPDNPNCFDERNLILHLSS
jgi:hypothetical protein